MTTNEVAFLFYTIRFIFWPLSSHNKQFERPRRKRMKRKVLSLLMIMVFLSTTNTNGYAANNTRGLTYWFSNADKVGRWKQTPKVFKYWLGNHHFNSAFNTAIDHARTQWSAAGIPVTPIGVATSADIVCLGGTYEEIYIYSGQEIGSNATGLAVVKSEKGIPEAWFPDLQKPVFHPSGRLIFIPK